MSKNFVPSPYDSEKIRSEGPRPTNARFSQGLPSSLANANPRPPAFFVTTGPRHVLNYSFQTGEEFALEFMQDRTNTRKPSVPTISEDRSTGTSYADQREQPNISEEKLQRKLLTYPSFNDTSSQGSSKRFAPESYDFEPTKMKFVCNFGGRFLPRPSDGQLRYVGGERHLLQINRDMSWQELIRKTTKLYRRAHTIKYHLPGEQVNVLISVASDDDLQHMIDECIVLEESEERPAMYLFSDDDDEHHVHFVVGSSSDADTEAQFIALANGLIGAGETLSAQGFRSAPANDLDQLKFDIDEEGSLAARSQEASMYTKSKPSLGVVTIPSKTSRGTLEKMPSSFRPRMSNQDYTARNDEGEVSSFSGRKARTVHLGSSVPSEFTYPAKREQGGGETVSKQQNELQRTNTNMTETVQRATRTQERGSSRRELLISLDDSGSKIPSPNSNYNSPMPRIGRADKFSQAQAEPLIQFSRSGDSAKFQQLMTQEPVGKSLYEMPASLSEDSETPVYQHASSDDTMMKPRRYNSEEDAMLHAATDQVSKNRNFQWHNMMEIADPTHASRSDESSAPIVWHDDMYISMDPDTQERLFVVSSRQKQQSAVTDVVPASCSKKHHPSRPTDTEGETVPPPRPFMFSDNKETELHPNSLLHGSRDNRQESSSAAKQDAESSKIARSRSLGNDVNSRQVRNPSQEAKESVTPPISELEGHETKNSEPALTSSASFGRDVISNVQIISNENLEDLREMGSGAFGTVFHGRWKGTDVAIKRIKNSCFTYPSSQADKLISEFWREAGIISKLHHPNVLAFYGVVNDGPGGTLATVTEFMVSGSLKKVLLRKDKFLDRRKRIMLAMDAAIGMEYLHAKQIVHFDLKCDNLLVNLKDPSRPICKVADFGLSKMKQTTMVSGGMRGTLPWMAPELLTMSSKVSEKVDLYSFGIVMWEILTGEEPYAGMHYGGVIGGILSNTLRPPVPDSCDPEWRKLMEQCWSTEPEQRPSFTEVAIRLRSMLEASQGQPVS